MHKFGPVRSYVHRPVFCITVFAWHDLINARQNFHMRKKFGLSATLLFLLLAANILQAQPVSFGIFTDVHYADVPDRGTRKYSQSAGKLAQCIDTMNREKVNFLVELGDFKDMPEKPDSQAALKFLEKIESVNGQFHGDRYHVLGNHDMDCISKNQFCAMTVNSGIPAGQTWYAFSKGGYRFIVLEACFDARGHAYDTGNFSWTDANLPSTELEWLDKEISGSGTPVIVFVHQLLYGDSQVTIRNAAAVRSILEKGKKVKCVFQGHEHGGGYEQINGIHYYTLKGLIEGNFPGSNSFAKVTLEKDQITIRGYGKAVTRVLPLN